MTDLLSALTEIRSQWPETRAVVDKAFREQGITLYLYTETLKGDVSKLGPFSQEEVDSLLKLEPASFVARRWVEVHNEAVGGSARG